MVHRKVINICYPPRVAIVTNIGCLSGLYMHGECGWKLQPTFNADNIYGVLSRKVMIKLVIHKIVILQATYTFIRSDNMCMSHIHTHKPGLYMHGECGWKLQPTFNADNIYRVLSRKVMVKPVNHKIAILQATYTLMRSDNMCMSHIHNT